MGASEAFERILTSMHDAMLDDARWPDATALIDEACGIGSSGSALLVGTGGEADAQVWFAKAYSHGERRQDLEREYFENYYPHDERVPRVRNLSDSRLVHISSLYTPQELKTSLTYNEGLRRTGGRNGLNVRLDGPHGSRIVWAISNPAAGDGWGSSQIEVIRRLLPHLRQFVYVRQALAEAEGLGVGPADLLDTPRIGVIHLDRSGRIVEANDLARSILARGHGLSERGGFLGAWLPTENARLQGLLADALPAFGERGVGHSMTVSRTPGKPRLLVHAIPLRGPRLDFGIRRIAALVLVVDPGTRPRIDRRLVAETLSLTPTQSEIAALLCEGRTVREIAAAVRRQEGAIHWHLHQIYTKLGISRQVELVRLVLSLSEFPNHLR